jgi:O-succinylbenzoic acid--CoA ligase
MYLDFENLNLDTIESEFGNDTYFNSVINFIRTYIASDSFISYTSGSTGEPKALLISKENALESAKLSNDFFGIDKATRFLHCLDIKYIGSKMMLIRAYLAGAKVEVVKPSLDFYLNSSLDEIDFVSLTPPHIHAILETQPSFFDRVRVCLTGASGVSTLLENKIIGGNFKTQFYESFAMTETFSHFAIRDISAKQTYFKLLKGFKISKNENNCLEVSHESILPDKIVTKDMIDIHTSDTFSFKGRWDNVINSGGLKINPESLEKEWSTFLPFKFIIAGEPNPIYDQGIIMVIDKINMKTKNEILDLLSQNKVPSRLHPKFIYYTNSWAETQTHKPLRIEILKEKIPLD